MIDKYASLKRTGERDVMNAFSFWYDKIKNIQSPDLKIPKSVIIPVPVEVRGAFYMESEKDMEAITRFTNDIVKPTVQEAKLGLLFIKNGSYSHKFDASHACLPFIDDLPNAIATVMYEAMLRCGFQYDGTDQLVLRQRVDHDANTVPCIYNGLPFRTEYRVFYDFDEKAPIFVHDYWDKDYVYPNLHDLTDRLIFDAWYPHIREEYEKNVDRVMQAVADAMAGVNGLSGPWSIDVMQDEAGNFWLIDMAVAEMSAYWEKRPGAALHKDAHVLTPSGEKSVDALEPGDMLMAPGGTPVPVLKVHEPKTE